MFFVLFYVRWLQKNTGKTDVVFWHAMGDPNDKILNSLILDFETENPNINIKAEYIGNYDVLMQKYWHQ